jgi:hypothetical protein
VRVLHQGTLRRIYVDRLALDDPDGLPYQILEGDIRNPIGCRKVIIHGRSELVFDSLHPLWSSARAWIETTAKLTLEP